MTWGKGNHWAKWVIIYTSLAFNYISFYIRPSQYRHLWIDEKAGVFGNWRWKGGARWLSRTSNARLVKLKFYQILKHARLRNNDL